MNKLMFITAFTLVCSSLLVMMFYLRMTFLSIMFFSIKTKTSMFKKVDMSILMLIISTMLMPVMIFIK